MCPIIIIVLFSPFVCDAANWAQSSGHRQQNTVLPYTPSADNLHWQARFGAAVAIYTTPSTANVADLGKMYLMGGDTNDGDPTERDFGIGLLDQKWTNGFKNDVWVAKGTEWAVGGDYRVRTEYRQKVSKVLSRLKWTLVQPGCAPDPGTTYDEWLVCEDFFANQPKYQAARAAIDCINNRPSVQWSPRRHHVAAFKDNYLWVFGGRAREYVTLNRNRTIGGLTTPIVNDVPRTANNRLQKLTSQREAIVVKNDVWKSLDGNIWELVTPGCRVPQQELITDTLTPVKKQGMAIFACNVDDDCYGNEECFQKTCVCKMWSPRELHQVVVYSGSFFLAGGYASQLYSGWSNCGDYACGDRDASSYRFYLNDVWYSVDGANWNQLVPPDRYGTYPYQGSFPPRGGHQMLLVPTNPDGTGQAWLWIVGGRGGDNSGKSANVTYYSDIWAAQIQVSQSPPNLWNIRNFWPHSNPRSPAYYPYTSQSSPTSQPTTLDQFVLAPLEWAPRTGHTAVLETASPRNQYTRTLYVVGGQGGDPSKQPFFNDVWAWRFDTPGERFRQDFTEAAYFGTGDGPSFHYANNSPTVYFVEPASSINQLQRWWLPNRFGKAAAELKAGKRLELRLLITPEKLQMLYNLTPPVLTIQDLNDIDKYRILKLRGFDYPQVPQNERMTFYDICDVYYLAKAVVKKCTLNPTMIEYNGEKNMPWNIVPEFGYGGTGEPNPYQPVAWHNRVSYDFMLPSNYTIDTWDGCTWAPNLETVYGVDVPGIGYVSQVKKIRDPTPELQELQCIQRPGPRAYHASLWFEERLYLFGGKQTEQQFMADTWYRDHILPVARMPTKPLTNTDNEWFYFASDKPGCYFEYKIWDPYNYIEIRKWTTATKKTNIGWLSWRIKSPDYPSGGPGNGWYQLYVRAVDPAGNRDEKYVMNVNVHMWYYVSPTPWDIIAEAVGTFLGLVLFGYLEYRRRVKKAAMERYAMKRMRRKFKALQRDIDGRSVDWRSLYMESKEMEIGGKKGKEKKKSRDKKADKREKEKKKREKEKEKIKRKMKENKDKAQKDKEKAMKDKEKEKGKVEEVNPEKDKEEEKKLKKYEKASTDETGTKQRKANKKYKEYEMEGGDGGGAKGDQKKNA